MVLRYNASRLPGRVTCCSSAQMATLAEVRLKEMEALSALRAANESKLLPAADCADLKVCVCQHAAAGAMLQCELCRDAFHSVCVSGPADGGGARQAWLCPPCRRSEKPALDKVLPLLAALQRIRVRLPEGDALRYVIERTVSWQRRARRVSSSSSSCGWPAPLSRWPATGPASPEGKVRHHRLCQNGGGASTSFSSQKRPSRFKDHRNIFTAIDLLILTHTHTYNQLGWSTG